MFFCPFFLVLHEVLMHRLPTSEDMKILLMEKKTW
jgi:hypothetical protein